MFFVSSVKTDEQVKYGISNDKKYFVKSDDPKPLVLADAGYYEISVNLLEGTYSVEKLATPESKYGEMYFVYGWADYPAMSQIDAENCPARWTIDYDLKNGGCDVGFGKGGGQWIVAAGSDNYHPEVWLEKEEKGKYPEYNGWFFDTTLAETSLGNCQIIFDNFLMRAYAMKK